MGRRIRDFESFYGQQRVVQTLRDLCDGVQARDGVLPPILLVGRAGFGKTALAEAVARHLARSEGDEPDEGLDNFHVIHAGKRVIKQIHAVLCRAKHGDVVFIDEAHALEREDAELLYLAVDRQKTFAMIEGKLDRTQFEDIEKVSLILATNLPGGLPKALRSRAVAIELDEYRLVELREIARRVAVSHGLNMTAQATRVVAQRCDGTPRSIEQLVTLIASMPHPEHITQGHVGSALQRCLGLNEQLLTPHQQKLLQELAKLPGLKSRAERVVGLVGLDAKHVRNEIEAPLERGGYLTIRADRVRELTKKGLDTATKLKAGNNDAEANLPSEEVEIASFRKGCERDPSLN